MYNEAKVFLDIYIEDYQSSPNPYKLLGYIYTETNQNDKAILNYEKYLKLVPKDKEIQNKLKDLKDKK